MDSLSDWQSGKQPTMKPAAHISNRRSAIRGAVFFFAFAIAMVLFGGWMLSQMDLGSAILAQRIAKGRVTTVAISGMAFLRSVPVGAIVSCYCELIGVGRSSMTINVEVWINIESTNKPAKVTEGEFVFVAIDDDGKTRAVPEQS